MVEGATVPAWRRYRVGMVVPDYSDACSFYRSYGPWARMAKKYPIELVPLEKASWVELSQLDLVYIARPYAPVHADFGELARNNGIPVWVDFDDLLTSVAISNPAYKYYGTETAVKSVIRAIQVSNVLTCATEPLLNEFSRVPGTRLKTVIPNACPLAYWRPLKQRHEKSFRIGWRGGRSHDEDLQEHLAAFEWLLNKDQRLQFYFFGEPSWVVRKMMPPERTTYIPLQDQLDYFVTLEQTNLDVLMVPLADTLFNKAKSNIAYIEGTMAGANIVGPRFPEWENLPGCHVYNTTRELAALVYDFYQDPKGSNNYYAAAHEHITTHLQLDAVNEKRWEICCEIARI